MVLKETLHGVLNCNEAVALLVIRHKHVRVDLMNEYFVVEVWLNLTSLSYQAAELGACGFIVRALSINHEDERSALIDLPFQIALENVVAREIHNIEVNVVVCLNCLSLYLLRR